MFRFCITARMFLPWRLLYIRAYTPPRQIRAMARMKIRFRGKARVLVTRRLFSIKEGASTPTFGAPNMERASCCSTRLTPQVTKRLSSVLPYRRQITSRSSTAPKRAAVRKDAAMATKT